MKDYFITCEHIIKLYEKGRGGSVAALRGIDLWVEEGEFISIVGPSGSGKTTLLIILAGFERSSAGKVIVNGKDLNLLSSRELNNYNRHEVGFLFQTPQQNLLWGITALENVRIPMKIAGRYSRQEQIKRAEELLDQVGLLHRKSHKPNQLSGGEAQRVGIAVALANDPKLVLADEPTGELDTASAVQIIKYFRKLNKELGKTFIVSTHDPRFANRTDRSLFIRDGRIVSVSRFIGGADFNVPFYLDSDPNSKMEMELKLRREELIYVDSQGAIHLPYDLFMKLGKRRYLKYTQQDGRVCFYPAENDSKVH